MGYKDPNDPRIGSGYRRWYARLKADPERYAEWQRYRSEYKRVHPDQVRLANARAKAKIRAARKADPVLNQALLERKRTLARERYRLDPDKFRGRNLARSRAAHARLSALKMERGCIDCGYRDAPEALHFDHVDRATKSFIISHLKTASEERLQAELVKCVVRCANCHAIRTAQQQRESGAFHRV